VSFAAGTRWVPKASGAVDLVGADGTVLLSVTAAGALTFGAAATTGALRVQNMTGTERDNISDPAAGMVIYNTSTNKLNVRVAAGWEAVTSA